jgi:N-methylhydantoinase B
MFLTHGHASVEGDGHRHAPWGIFGGQDGSCGDLILNPQSDKRKLPAMISNLSLKAGDTLRTISPCGGGYGPAGQRDAAAVREDVLDGLLLPENAAKDYNVVITDQFTVDEAATHDLRRD